MPKIKVGQALIHYHRTGEGEPLLLIAGLGGDLYNWKNAIPHLQGKHRVIAFDNRGAGLTEAPATAFSMETLADDAAGLLDALEIRKAHIIGWSMGGNVAQELTLRHPKRVGTLVLMSTYARAPGRSRFALDTMIRGLREGSSPATAMMMMRAWCSTEAAFADELSVEPSGSAGRETSQEGEGTRPGSRRQLSVEPSGSAGRETSQEGEGTRPGSRRQLRVEPSGSAGRETSQEGEGTRPGSRQQSVPRTTSGSKGPNGVEGFANQKKALDGFDSRKRLKGLRVPTLLVHGTDDIMVPPDFARELAAGIHGARLHWIKGAGHFLPPKGWAQPVLDFIARHPLD
jgi:pimeloyl-ACP methyl ester carboxylesterase